MSFVRHCMSFVRQICLSQKKIVALHNFKKEIMNNKKDKIQTDEIELTKKLFEVKGENGTQLIAIHDVVYLEANGSYAKLHSFYGRVVTVSSNLKSTIEQLEADHCDSFIRINRSIAVNCHYILSMVGNELTVSMAELTVPMGQKQKFTIGRTYKDEFRKQCICLRKK